MAKITTQPRHELAIMGAESLAYFSTAETSIYSWDHSEPSITENRTGKGRFAMNL